MTFMADDFKRQVLGDAKIYVPGFSDLKGAERQRIFEFIWSAVYSLANEGERDARRIRRRVLRMAREEFGSIILTAILMALIGFVATRILERLFPKTEESAE